MRKYIYISVLVGMFLFFNFSEASTIQQLDRSINTQYSQYNDRCWLLQKIDFSSSTSEEILNASTSLTIATESGPDTTNLTSGYFGSTCRLQLTSTSTDTQTYQPTTECLDFYPSSTFSEFSYIYLSGGSLGGSQFRSVGTSTKIFSEALAWGGCSGSPYATDTIAQTLYFSLDTNATATTTPPYIGGSCSSISNWFGRAVCEAVAYLFYPPDTVLDYYTNLKTDLESKPPLGYFTAAKNAILTFSSSTTSTIQIGMATSSPAIELLKGGVQWLLWFLFIFWLFYKMRNVTI